MLLTNSDDVPSKLGPLVIIHLFIFEQSQALPFDFDIVFLLIGLAQILSSPAVIGILFLLPLLFFFWLLFTTT